VIAGTTPADADDTGAADPGLAAALAAADDVAVRLAMLSARLLVPVVATPADGEADLAVPALVAADGRRALPVFTSYDALQAWQPDARPVPMAGIRVLAGAQAEGYDAVVVDVAGPIKHAVDGDDLRVLADVAVRLLADPTMGVASTEDC
jgi:hypothetical protein